jgi:hypothetical protein
MSKHYRQWYAAGEPPEGGRRFNTDEKIGHEEIIESSDEDTDDEVSDSKNRSTDTQDGNTEDEVMSEGSDEDMQDEMSECEEMMKIWNRIRKVTISVSSTLTRRRLILIRASCGVDRSVASVYFQYMSRSVGRMKPARPIPDHTRRTAQERVA